MNGTLLGIWRDNLSFTAAMLALLFLFWGAGRRLLDGCRLDDADRGERILLSLGLGMGTTSVAVLLMGLARFLTAPFINLLLASLAVAALFSLRKERRTRTVHASRSPLSSPSRAAILAGAAAAAVTWLAALSPTVFYDALVYHLALPNLYLLRGGIFPLPVVYSRFPPGGEMLYLLGLYAGGTGTASLLNFAAGALAAGALATFTGRHWGRETGLTAGTLFYLAPPVFLLSRYAGVENLMTFYILLACLCLYRRLEGGKRSWMILAGLFSGFALSMKYVGGLWVVLLPATALAATSGRPHGLSSRRLAADTGLFLLAASLVCLPWLLVNLVWTGNPVFPAFHSLLGGRGWSAEQAALLALDAKAASTMLGSWPDFVRLPLALAAGSRDFGAAGHGLWFWPLCFPAAAALAFRRGWKERLLVGLIGGSLALWASTFLMARFLLPTMALGAATVAFWLVRAGARLRVIPPVFLAVILLANVAFFAVDGPTRSAFLPSLGLQSRSAYLSSMIRIWPAVETVNRDLLPGARVLVLGDAKVAYLERDHLYTTALDRPLLPALLGGRTDEGGMAGSLAARGITHVLVNVRELKRLEREYPVTAIPPAMRDAFLLFLDARCRRLYSGDGIYLFELCRPS